MPIHPTAIVDPSAKIADSADIGPYSIIGADVEIGARTQLKANVVMEGPLSIGEDNVFFPYSTVGVAPQDLKYHGERSCTHIGHRNKIREFVTIHRGTEGGGMLTSIGDDNLLDGAGACGARCTSGQPLRAIARRDHGRPRRHRRLVGSRRR